MMNITRYNEGQAVAGASFLHRFLLYDFQFLHQILYMSEVGIVLEPANELGALFRSNAVDAGKLIIKHAEPCGFYQFLDRIAFNELFGDITSTQRDVQCIEQMTPICISAFADAFQHIAYTLLSESFPGRDDIGMIGKMIKVCILTDQAFVYQLPDGLFRNTFYVQTFLAHESRELLQLLRRTLRVGTMQCFRTAFAFSNDSFSMTDRTHFRNFKNTK